jgi:2-dehydro-3-deoxygalactonokinase
LGYAETWHAQRYPWRHMTATSETAASICVDMGTTNTRLWIVQNQNIVDRSGEQVGLRNAARERNKPIVRDTLARLLSVASSRAAELGLQADCVLAAGMLTSPLGLCEVPHIPTPAGEEELARSLHEFSDPTVTDLPIYLVPGVRSGPRSPALEDLENTDLIRGEETIVVGLANAGILLPNTTLLNLGSHWKAIAIDENGRIASSFTTLSGEFIHALQTQTVLASALPQGRLETVDAEWLDRGRRFENRNGTGRTMFGVRLLEQIFHIGPAALSSFLQGAIVESDLKSMERAGVLNGPILITGEGAAPEAWQRILESTGRKSEHLPAKIVEQGFVQGLVRLFHLFQDQRTHKGDCS